MQHSLKKLLEELDQISNSSKDNDTGGGAVPSPSVVSPMQNQPEDKPVSITTEPKSSTDSAVAPTTDATTTAPITPAPAVKPDLEPVTVTAKPPEKPKEQMPVEKPAPARRPAEPTPALGQLSAEPTPITRQRAASRDRPTSSTTVTRTRQPTTSPESSTLKARTSQYRPTPTEPKSIFQTVRQYASKFAEPRRAASSTTSSISSTRDQAVKDKKIELTKLDQAIKEKQRLISKLSKQVDTKPAKEKDEKPKRKGTMSRRTIKESLEMLDHISHREDKVDTVTIDVPLLLRIMEYAREDAADDMDLHSVTERMIELSKGQDHLSMDDYDAIVAGTQEPADGEEDRVNESDISGLWAASELNHSYIVKAETAEGQIKRFRVKAQSERVAREKFLNHHNQARIIDIKQEY